MGRNALDAMINLFVSISQWRAHARPGDSIHGVITHGGDVPNVIPAETAARFLVRSASDDELDGLLERLEEMAAAAAQATGCTADVAEGSANRCRTMWNNPVLAERWREHLLEGGGTDEPPPAALGSSDMGNVSQVVPTIHPYLAVAAAGTGLHTSEFARQTTGPRAQRALRLGIRTLAAVVLDLITQRGLVQEARAAFELMASASRR
jgi:metal-dependent amidase/aminoacylase/carboxypeptidase family protein